MRVLVTGGAGFVGSHVVRACRARGDDVTALDDLSTGRPGNLPRGVRLVTADVRDRAAVEAETARADLVVHLAAAVGVRRVADDPVGTWSRNVLGTAAVLDACAARGVRVLVASTSEVYGPGRAGPLREDEPLRLDAAARRDVYALSKAAGEAYAVALHRARGLPATVARLFNVVGPRQSGRYGMVLPRFAAAARAGARLPVHGDGTQRRCFLHAQDAAEALLALAGSPETQGVVVNVGSDEETSILDLARMVLAETGVEGEEADARIERVPFERVYGEGFSDFARRRPDLARLRSATGFAPQRTLRDAVRDVLEAVPAEERVTPP
jgi:UDP-glucose 4-epimerase